METELKVQLEGAEAQVDLKPVTTSDSTSTLASSSAEFPEPNDAKAAEVRAPNESEAPAVAEASIESSPELKTSENKTRKRKLDGDETPQTRDQKIKRQIEYYFSDDNMKYDEFFQKKIAESEGWLEFQWLLSCSNLKALGCTADDIRMAIESNELFSYKQDDAGLCWMQSKKPLPELLPAEERLKQKQERRKSEGRGNAEKKAKRDNPKHPKRASDLHAAGCLVLVENIPGTVTQWGAIRDCLNAAFLKNGRCTRFVSQTKSDNTCFALFHPFAADKELIVSTEVLLEGQKLNLVLLNSSDRRMKTLMNLMPPGIRQSRDKEMTNPKIELLKKPMELAGQSFSDYTHLRSCTEELLEKTETDTTLPKNGPADSVIKALLAYHPQFAHITAESIIVRTMSRARGGADAKTFAVTRSTEAGDFTTENFSHWKCLGELAKNPPVKQEKPGEACGVVSQEVSKETSKGGSEEVSEETSKQVAEEADNTNAPQLEVASEVNEPQVVSPEA